MKKVHGNTGKKRSPETLLRMSISHLGQKGFWTGKKRPPHSEETRKRISEVQRGRILSEETKKNHSIGARKAGCGKWMKGRKMPLQLRRRQSERLKGDKSHFWRGGIYPRNLALRKSLDYKLWREAVFARDNFTCQDCGDKTGGNLEADHIKPFSLFPELRFAIDNGRTLCHICHQKTPTYGGALYNNLRELRLR